MKKIVMLAAIAASAMLVSCNGNKAAEQTVDSAAVVEEVVEPVQEAVEATVEEGAEVATDAVEATAEEVKAEVVAE